MSEKINFKKLEQSFGDENLAASEIFSRLEALTVDMEFEAFMREHMVSKYQRVKIPTLLVALSDQSNPLKEASIFPERFRLHKGRFMLLQDLSTDDWQFSAMFKTDDYRYKCLGDEAELSVTKSDKKPKNRTVSEMFEPKMTYHFLHTLLMASGFDPQKYDLAEWEKVCSGDEISSAILGNLANHHRYETVVRTKPIACPDGHTVIASQIERTDNSEGSDIIADVTLDFLKQLGTTKETKPKVLNYTYQTYMNGDPKDLVTSRVTWQILDGDVNGLSENLEAAKLLQTDSQPDELSPINNIAAWNTFMQIADQSLAFAMREA